MLVVQVSSGPESPSAANSPKPSKTIWPLTLRLLCLKMAASSSICASPTTRSRESHGRCLLQLWSEERNRGSDRTRNSASRAFSACDDAAYGSTQTAGARTGPTSDRRTPTARDSARRNYQRLLERVLTRAFIGAKVDGFRSAMDLEHSFGPAYVRGRLLKGTAADAVIGISHAESSAAIDGILTLGILWLDFCRQKSDARRHFGGLKVVVPAGAWRTTAERIAWMNHSAADFQLYALDERTEELELIDYRDCGNQIARLMHAFSPEAVLERCKSGIDRMIEILPEGGRSRVDIHPRSPSEVGLLLHGLEFARVRRGASVHSFATQEEITFGAGANETPLTAETEDLCRELCARLFTSSAAGWYAQ